MSGEADHSLVEVAINVQNRAAAVRTQGRRFVSRRSQALCVLRLSCMVANEVWVAEAPPTRSSITA